MEGTANYHTKISNCVIYMQPVTTMRSSMWNTDFWNNVTQYTPDPISISSLLGLDFFPTTAEWFQYIVIDLAHSCQYQDKASSHHGPFPKICVTCDNNIAPLQFKVTRMYSACVTTNTCDKIRFQFWIILRAYLYIFSLYNLVQPKYDFI